MDAAPADETLALLHGARPQVPAAQADSALERLRAALFGAAPGPPSLTRYPIVRELGSGGAGVVYLARDTKLDRLVAVKLIGTDRSGGTSGTDSRERLLREAEALARAPHPNNISIFDVGTTADRNGEPVTFLVLEFVEGADLRAWLAAEHGWRRVLEVFVAAGRGLAAAHAAGVIHRDFKPANAMLGNDGRVRVLDFGLAHAASHDRRSSIDDASLDSARAEAIHTEAIHTEKGVILGTPAYMSTEQHAGDPATAASDQYSFCLALWEGLYGARPFRGHDLATLESAKRRGPPRVAPPTGVPRALVEVVRRGLAPAPSDRFVDMNALLDALHAAAAPRRPWAAVAVGVALVGAGATWASADDGRCARERPDREHAIAAAVAGSSEPLLRERVAARVTAFDAAWAEQRAALCDADDVSHGDAFDRAMACLDRQRRDTDTILAVLAGADGVAAGRELDVLASLPEPSRCADAEYLATTATTPSDPARAAEVEQVRAELTRVRALATSGQVTAATEAARATVVDAEQLGYAPLFAEALHVRGNVEEEAGDYESAAQTLERAYDEAIAASHDWLAAHAAANLVWVVGHRQARLESALTWAARARAARRRLTVAFDDSRITLAVASAEIVAGHPREAAAAAEQALAEFTAAAIDDDGRLGLLHNNISDAKRQIGDLVGAAHHLEEAEAAWSRHYGPDHPRMTLLLVNRSTLATAESDHERAAALATEVLARRERTLGPQHPAVAHALANLAVPLRHLERLDEAVAALERATAILRALGPGHERILLVTSISVARIHAERGNHRVALDELDRGIATAQPALPDGHLDLGRALVLRGRARVRLGEVAAGVAEFEQGLASSVESYGAGHEKVARAQLDLVRDLAASGRTADAIARAKAARLALGDPASDIARDLDTWLAGATAP